MDMYVEIGGELVRVKSSAEVAEGLRRENAELRKHVAKLEAQTAHDDKVIRAFYADHPEWEKSASKRSLVKAGAA